MFIHTYTQVGKASSDVIIIPITPGAGAHAKVAGMNQLAHGFRTFDASRCSCGGVRLG